MKKKHLEYQTIYKHNDVYFAFLSVALAERIAAISRPLVYHRINNPQSLQGKSLPAYPYLTEAFGALKQSLIAHGRFHGSIRDGYNNTLSKSIESRAMKKPEVMLSEDYYTAMKQNLIPKLFDSPEDFSDDTVIPGVIYRSADYENYLVVLINEIVSKKIMMNEMVSKKGKDYIIGHALLAIPRFIRNKIRYGLGTGSGVLRWKN